MAGLSLSCQQRQVWCSLALHSYPPHDVLRLLEPINVTVLTSISTAVSGDIANSHSWGGKGAATVSHCAQPVLGITPDINPPSIVLLHVRVHVPCTLPVTHLVSLSCKLYLAVPLATFCFTALKGSVKDMTWSSTPQFLLHLSYLLIAG